MDLTPMLIGGEWRAAASSRRAEDVTSPYDGTVVGTVPVAGIDDVDAALTAAEAGAVTWRRTPAHERMQILPRTAEIADERAPEIARTISAEVGKTIGEATREAGRSAGIIRLAAFEGTQLYGKTLPLDANPGTGLDKIGFTVRQPCGVVVAISPFNYPALLVLHKVAPALAAGNAVVLKPASATPLTALTLAHMPAGRPRLTEAAGLAGRAALIGTPVMVALFLLFPRLGPLWAMPGGGAKTGLSDNLQLGDVAELANNEEIAFRLRFEGPSPPAEALYFRGPVLSDYDGRRRRAFEAQAEGDLVVVGELGHVAQLQVVRQAGLGPATRHGP